MHHLAPPIFERAESEATDSRQMPSCRFQQIHSQGRSRLYASPATHSVRNRPVRPRGERQRGAWPGWPCERFRNVRIRCDLCRDDCRAWPVWPESGNAKRHKIRRSEEHDPSRKKLPRPGHAASTSTRRRSATLAICCEGDPPKARGTLQIGRAHV